MGFNSVYKILQEVFPQVDSRILRAVAIENSKDADVAVGVVLSEIVPSLTVKNEKVATSPNHVPSLPNPYEDIEVSNTAVGTSSAAVNYGVSEEVIGAQQVSSRKPGESISADFGFPFMNFKSSVPSNVTKEVRDQVFVDAVDEFSENVSLSGRHQVAGTEEDPVFPRRLSYLLAKRGNQFLNDTDGFANSLSLHEEEQSSLDELVRKNHRSATPVAHVDPAAVQIISLDDLESNSQHVTEAISPVTKVEEPEADIPSVAASGGDICSTEMVDCQNVDMVSVDCQIISLNDLESNSQHVTEVISPVIEVEEPEADVPSVAASGGDICSTEMVDCQNVDMVSVEDSKKQEPSGVNSLFASDMGDFEDDTSMKDIVSSRSGQMVSAELLEGIIENEKSEKIALRSAKDSLLSFINEVEIKEKSVEKAREEAARGGLDTLARVEDLKKMLRHAKEANDMHAGEVYGEKAILSTEMRELQSRLHSLSDERVKALAILDEIHQALEVRLVSAEAEIKEAECEKLKKEKSALEYLAREESRMQKVAEESKILEQQAEENSKLREFLIDRGQLVDMLQGEISVICQDVKSLKTRFDQGVPLSKSLSSSQTTSISTFSSSSLLGASFEKLPEVEVVASPNRSKSLSSSQTTSISGFSSSSLLGASFEKLPEPEVVASPKSGKASSSMSTDDELLYENEILGTGKELVDDGWELFDI